MGFGLLGMPWNSALRLSDHLNLTCLSLQEILKTPLLGFWSPTPYLLSFSIYPVDLQSHCKKTGDPHSLKNRDLSRRLLAVKAIADPWRKARGQSSTAAACSRSFFRVAHWLSAPWQRQQQLEWDNPGSLEFWWIFILLGYFNAVCCEERLIETSMGNLRVLPWSSFRGSGMVQAVQEKDNKISIRYQ